MARGNRPIPTQVTAVSVIQEAGALEISSTWHTDRVASNLAIGEKSSFRELRTLVSDRLVDGDIEGAGRALGAIDDLHYSQQLQRALSTMGEDDRERLVDIARANQLHRESSGATFPEDLIPIDSAIKHGVPCNLAEATAQKYGGGSLRVRFPRDPMVRHGMGLGPAPDPCAHDGAYWAKSGDFAVLSCPSCPATLARVARHNAPRDHYASLQGDESEEWIKRYWMRERVRSLLRGEGDPGERMYHTGEPANMDPTWYLRPRASRTYVRRPAHIGDVFGGI